MFFYLSKIFTWFFFPYNLFLLLCAAALFFMRKSWFKRIYAAALIGILFLSSGQLSSGLLGFLENRYPYRALEDVPPAEAVVVLSGMINSLAGRSDRPEFLSSADRILVGEEILRSKRANYLVISGGSGLILQKGESEAVILNRWLERRGVASEQILIDADSRNTAENAIETAKIAKARGWKRVLLVTSAFHMPRSVLCFRKAGLEVVPVPADYYTFRESPGPEAWFPSMTSLELGTLAIKEYIGIAAYRLRGYL